ncbi:MAG: hypothetical protein LCH57_14320 [Proteobacteria bacterium]|uniref:hypothetical protein n=1 Tax=Brevundimonas sp. TaxID=1871086 RepID=UPI0025BAAF5B|nr:hypothetical protein [Brevundimonas sp.]MCA0369212.1 hypothetical protein [Pseudomonadota bacterium]
MQKLVLSTAAMAFIAMTGAAQAQTAPTPAPANTPSAAPNTQARYSVDTTPLETLEADPAAKALVVKHVGAIFDHSAYAMIKTMTLKAIQPYSQGAITDEKLAALQAELAALK